jgi:glycosyltransferase involved in cell wall biosynthesis
LWRAHGIAADRVDIVPGGVDLNRFCPAVDKAALRNELGIPQDRFVVLTVRNLVPRMGVDRLVQAMQAVSAEIPQALLVIGGHGPLRAELLTIGNRLGLQDHVRMVGFVPEEVLARYYQMADLFVLPSLDLEGFGMVTLEAMACGLPVIGTPVGGTTEILSGFNRRYLLRGSGIKEIAEGIISQYELISASRTRALEISRECRRHVEARYSWNQNIATLERLFYQAKYGRLPGPDVVHAGISPN